MTKAQELLKLVEQLLPKQEELTMSGHIRFEKDVGLIFQSENEQGENVAIVIPMSKEDLLQVLNQSNESICENIKIKGL